MINLTNSAMRYTAALRVYVSLQIVKHGLNVKHLEKLRKIYIAEAFFDHNTTQSVNIKKLIFNLFEAVSAIKPEFQYKCVSHGNFFINKKLLTILLLNLCRMRTSVIIESKHNSLLIKCNGKIKSSLSTVKALKGYCLFEIKSNQTLIIIPTLKTCQKSVPIENDWYYLFDKFSVLNIFFTRIL